MAKKHNKNRFIGIIFLILISATSANAINYYFSNSGNDAHTSLQAQNPATPWQTISKLNSIISSLLPGDAVLFKCGDTFYGSFTVTVSGSLTSPIIFGSYGIGAKPIITGLTSLTTWTAQGANKWEADCPSCGAEVNMLVLNNKPQAIGRYPNSNSSNKGNLNFESSASNTASSVFSITDNELTGSPNWTGAEVIIRSSRWTIDRKTISSHVGSNITFTNATHYALTNGYGYFIQNHPNTLDQYGEWHYNPVTKKVNIYTNTSNPASQNVFVSTQSVLIQINNRNYIEFDGLSFSGANYDVFNVTLSKGLTIKNCDVSFTGRNVVQGDRLDVFSFESNEIKHTNNNVLGFLNPLKNSIIKNNTLKNTGVFPGMGMNGTGSRTGMLLVCNNTLIENNSIDSTGYAPILFYGDSITVKNNFIDTYAFVLDDGGGIYTWNGCSNNVSTIYWVSIGTMKTYRKIINNIVLNGIGAAEGTNDLNRKGAEGIYLDDNSTGVEVSGNTVANCAGGGVLIHNSYNNTLRNNTSFNNGTQLLFYGDPDINSCKDTIRNNAIKNNILFSKLSFQEVMRLNADPISKIHRYGTFDTNYYCRPFNENNIINVITPTSSVNQNLSQWKTAYPGQDINSNITPLQFPLYSINNLIGSNLVSNGTYNSNTSGFSAWSAINSQTITWENNGVLDGGYIKYSPTTVPNNTILTAITITVGAIDLNKKYILRFSTKGTQNCNIEINLRKEGPNYNNLCPFQTAYITTSRNEHEFLFEPTITEANSVIQIYVYGDDGTIYFDNIELFEANITYTDPDDHILFEYNATQNVKTVALAHPYIYVKGNLYQGTVTLQPFTSIILLYSLGVDIKELKSNIINNIQVYPNPVLNSFTIKSDKLINEVILLNVIGQVVMQLRPNLTQVEINSTYLPQGVYFIKSNLAGNWVTNKVIKR
jgi:parallel beta-helix repeat protein